MAVLKTERVALTLDPSTLAALDRRVERELARGRKTTRAGEVTALLLRTIEAENW